MSDLWIIALVLIGVLALWFAVQKGWIKSKNLDGLGEAAEIAKMILAVADINDVTKNRIKFILDITDLAVNYVANLSGDNADKEALTIEAINVALKKIGVVPTVEEQALIHRLVIEVLELYEKNILK